MQFKEVRKSEPNGKQPSLGLCGLGFTLFHAVEHIIQKQIPLVSHGIVGIYTPQGMECLVTDTGEVVAVLPYVDGCKPRDMGILPEGDAEDHCCASITFVGLIQGLLAL